VPWTHSHVGAWCECLCVVQLADQRAAAQRAEEAAAADRKSAFVAMLDSKAKLLEGARFSKVEALFFEDARFEALPEQQRQSAFSDWQEARRRKAEEEERALLQAKVRISGAHAAACLYVHAVTQK
jgi:hypothetical protein